MLRFSSRLIFAGALLAGCLVCLIGAKAQTWTKIGSLPHTIRCAYFWDTSHGVIAGDSCIYTYNSGVWKEAIYPEEPAIIFSTLRLFDSTHIYAAPGPSDVWVSTDRGATWVLSGLNMKLQSSIEGLDIYKRKDGVIRSSAPPWQAANCFAQIDTNILLATQDDAGGFQILSTDGGTLWSHPNFTTRAPGGGYSCFGDTCRKAFFVAAENGWVWRSNDSGKSWKMDTIIITPNSRRTDIMAGCSGGAIYQQGQMDEDSNITYGDSGIFRSLDGGVTWEPIGGPPNQQEDIRMFAFGTRGEYLIAQRFGNVYLWSDPTTVAQPNPLMPTDTTIIACQAGSIDLTVRRPKSSDVLHLSLLADSVGSIIFDTSIIFPSSVDTMEVKFPVHWQSANVHSIAYFHAWTEACAEWDSTEIITFDAVPTVSVLDFDTEEMCNLSKIPLIISDCAGETRVDSVWLDSPDSVLKLRGAFPDTIFTGINDTILITVASNIPGSWFASCHALLTSLISGRQVDTTILLQVKVLPDREILRTGAPAFISNCSESSLPVVLMALPCDSVQFTSCTLTLSTPFQYSTNLSFPRTLAAGEVDTLLINFPPQHLNGTYIVTAHVTGKYLGSLVTFDTTIQIRVTFTSSAGALAASINSIDLDTITSCASADTLITLTNLGCDSIIVTGDETTWLPNWSADDPTFPFPLAPDSSFTVRVHYVPSTLGWSQQLVNYSFTDIDGNAEKSLPLALTATAISAPSNMTLSDTMLAFGTFARCNASGDTSVRITNTGCDSLVITGASLDAGTGFSLTNGGDTVLAPNQSAEFEIEFSDSTAGQYASALHIHVIGAHGGRAFDTTIGCSATIVPGTKLETLDPPAIDFGTTSICEELDSSVTITNIGCEPDTIGALAFANSSFSSPETEEVLIIPPDSQVTVPIFTHGDTNGHTAINRDTLVFTGNLDAPLPPVLLSRSLTYPGAFALSLAVRDSAPVSTTVPVYILRKGTVPAAADEIDFALTYDDDLLGFSSVLDPDITSSSPKMLANGLTLRTFTMKPAADRDTIATLAFESYLTKHEQTPITLSEEKFLSGGETSPPCVASLDTNAPGAAFRLELACGDGEITNAMEDLPLKIISMRVSTENLNVTLARGDARYATCTAQVLDILGTEKSEQTIALEPITQASLALGTLPAGAYFLRIASAGYVLTQRFVIVK